MSVLAFAMILTGAGELQRGVPIEPQLPPPPIAVPSPPVPPSAARSPRNSPRRAPANLNSYFSFDDYPPAAIRARHMGTAGFRVTIDTSGRVSDCEITASSGSQPLDAVTCWAMRTRARYTPALTADGTPTTGHDSGSATWRLSDEPADRAGLGMSYVPARLLTPDAERVSPADFPPGGPRISAMTRATSELRVAVGREGQVIGCDVETGSGSRLLDAVACRLFSERARFEPGRNAAGAAVCDVSWIDIDWHNAAAGRRPVPRDEDPPAERPPVRLNLQLNDQLCPGWKARPEDTP